MIKFVFSSLFFLCFPSNEAESDEKETSSLWAKAYGKFEFHSRLNKSNSRGEAGRAKFFSIQARLVFLNSQKLELKLNSFSRAEFIYLTSLCKWAQPISISPVYTNKPSFIMLSLAYLLNETKNRLAKEPKTRAQFVHLYLTSLYKRECSTYKSEHSPYK